MKAKKGFTLIELLVVISIIALLISILLPALNRAKMHATGTACLMNLKSLGLAWTMYADENEGHLCSGEVWANYNNVKKFDWVHPYISTSHPNYRPEMSDHQRELEGIKSGSLYTYTKATDVYNCPGDKEWKRATNMNANTSPFRSFAMTRSMNAQWGPAENRYKKMSDISRPSGKLVFLEEQEKGGVNWGSWILPTNVNDRRWWDPIAIWHSSSSTNLGFADGHAEPHMWVDDSTLYMAETQTQGVDPSQSPWNEQIDLDYIRRIYHDAYAYN